MDVETHVPAQPRLKTFVRRSPRTFISVAPLRMVVLAEALARDASPIRVSAVSLALIEPIFNFSHDAYLCSAERKKK